MPFQLTDDQRALRAGPRELPAARFDRDALRAAAEAPGLDRALWRTLGEAGFFVLRLPETDGGVGLGLPEGVLQHARARKQFGRPIGVFQAVQHLCAQMLVRTEPARAAVYAAAVTPPTRSTSRRPGCSPTRRPCAEPATVFRCTAEWASPGKQMSVRI